MPLTSDPAGRSSFESEGIVRFPMFDGDRIVPCAVTAAALLILATREGIEQSPIEAIFERFRSDIEATANRKHDHGGLHGDAVVVDTADI